MLRILNRIAWILSLTIGWMIMFYIASIFDYNDIWDWFVGIMLVGVIFGLIIKWIFLSRSFIERHLDQKYDNTISSKAFIWESGHYTQNLHSKPTEQETIDETPVDWHLNPTEATHVPKNNEALFSKKLEESEVTEEIEEIEEVVRSPREPNFFEKFFAENVIAKIGGILLFLGVLFFLWLVYDSAGPVGRIIIGFAIGFTIYGVGVVLDKKDLVNESRVLLGIGILVNYLVILAGRYFLGWESVLINEWLTLVFLIMNTVFGIVTSLIYRSKTLLVFSFIVAYLNPFLIGAKAGDAPYTLVWYSLILTFGAFVLSYLNQEKDIAISRFLLIAGFIGGGILCFLAPFSDTVGWIIKLVGFTLVSLSTIILAYRQKYLDAIPFFLIASYSCIVLFLINGFSRFTVDQINFAVFLIPMLVIVGVFITNSFLFALKTSTNLLVLLFAPLPIIVWLIISGVFASYFAIMLGMMVILYLGVFAKLMSKLSIIAQYVYFAVLWIFFFISSTVVNFAHIGQLIPTEQAYTLFIIAGVFLIACYYLSTRKDLSYLYTIGSLGTVFILLPLIKTQWILLPASIASISIFGITNMLHPFWSRTLREDSAQNIIIGFIIGLLFVWGQLYNFWSVYFPGVSLGLGYMGLAVVYTIFGMFMIQLLGVTSLNAEKSKPSSEKNIVFAYLGVALSLFTLAIALVLSSHPEIVWVVWLFEATILFWFSRVTKENKVFVAAIIVMIIGLGKMSTLFSLVQPGEYKFLLPLILILGSFFENLYLLSKDTNDAGWRLIHDILHIIGMILVALLLKTIIISSGLGYNIIGMSLFLFVLSAVYTFWGKRVLSMALLIGTILIYLTHISEANSILWNIELAKTNSLKFLQYGTIFIFWAAEYLFNTKSRYRVIARVMQVAFWVYAFIISTIFVHNIFTSPFSITIYWGVIAFSLLMYGIEKDRIAFRTTGLYILSLTLIKILFYDIWYSIENGIVRVVALMLVGALMIIISSMYTKRFKWNLMKEFNIANAMTSEEFEIEEDEAMPSYTTENSANTNYVMNQKIADVSIENLSSAVFIQNDGKRYEIRTKNMIRLAKMVIDGSKKTQFEAWELLSTFEYIVANYQSEVSVADYKKIVSLLEEFVKNGGEIILQ